MMKQILESEEGHAAPFLGTFAGGAGAVLLAIGAANDNGVLAIVGGSVLAVALTVTTLLSHMTIHYGIFSRLDEINK